MSERSEQVAPADWLDRWGPRTLAVVVVAAIVARLWLVFHRLWDPDELEHLHAGFCVWRGMVPYRDFFEQHGPVLWYVSLPLFWWRGASLDVLAAGRFVIWVLGAITIALVWRLGNRLYGRWGGSLASLLLVLLPPFQEKNIEWRPDNVAVPLVLIALCAAADSFGPRGWRWAGVFGASLAGGFFCTQKVVFVAAGMVAGYFVTLFVETRRRVAAAQVGGVVDAELTGRGFWSRLGAAIAGAVLVAGGFMLFFSAQGSLDDFLRDTIWRPLNWKSREPVRNYLNMCLIEGPVFYGAAAAGLVLTLADARHAAALRSGVLVLIGGVLAHAAGLLVVPAAFLQYYLPHWPLAALFGARALSELVAKSAVAAGTARGTRWLAVAAAIGVTATAIFRAWKTSPVDPVWHVAVIVALVLGSAATLLATRRLAVFALIASGAVSAAPFHHAQFVAWSRTHEFQVLHFQRLLRATDPEDQFLDGFTGFGALRPHAFAYFWINHHSWPMVPDAEKVAGVRRALADERTRVVLMDGNLRRSLSAEVISFLVENFEIDARYSWPGCAIYVRHGRELPTPFDWPSTQ